MPPLHTPLCQALCDFTSGVHPPHGQLPLVSAVDTRFLTSRGRAFPSAARHIERGDADLMLAGGAEAAIIPSGIGGFIACKVALQSPPCSHE